MADSKTIKSKLKTVGNIKKITRAMEMVATSKMKKSVDKALSVRPFSYFGLEFLLNFEQYAEKYSHALYTESAGTRTLIVEIASNKGLVGGYNGNMFRELRAFLEREKLTDVDYIAVGKYAVQHVHKLGGNLIHQVTDFSPKVTLEQVEELVAVIKKEYVTGNYKKVLIAHTHFVSTLSQKPAIYQLLPISPLMIKNQLVSDADVQNRIEVMTHDMSSYVIEPTPEVVLDAIIPRLLTAQMYQSVLEAMASEQAAQMVAMKNATENADSLEEQLQLSFNHIRQEGITRELSEIAAGAEVLSH